MAAPGGRKKGGKNLSTLRKMALTERAKQHLMKVIGADVFDGDAHTLLMYLYMNPGIPLEIRFEAAKAALPYEKPRLQAIGNMNDKPLTIIIAKDDDDTPKD